MDAEVGSKIKIAGRTVGAPERSGTVIDVRENGFLVVQWDSGQESMLMPGTDAQVESSSDDRSNTLLGCQIEMRLTENDHECHADATLMTRRGAFQATGVARRHPDDPSVPIIGEELAIARALRDLAGQLEAAADDAIGAPVDDERHLL